MNMGLNHLVIKTIKFFLLGKLSKHIMEVINEYIKDTVQTDTDQQKKRKSSVNKLLTTSELLITRTYSTLSSFKIKNEHKVHFM